MTITEFGRVELDITKVPTFTLASKRPAESFEDRLSHAQESRPNGETGQRHERVDARNPEIPKAPDAGKRPGELADGDARANATEAVSPGAPQDTTSLDDMHQEHPEEGPVRRAAAGKDPGPSSSFTAQQGVRLTGQGSSNPAPSDHGPQALGVMDAAGTHPGTGSQPQGQTQPQAQPDGQTKAVAEAPKGAGRAGMPRSTAPAGYRTVNAAMLRAAEAARDSVIKQIALKLGPDGGEMRVQLDPPELGRLDLRMVVEKGAVLKLSIAAERPEVLMMLDKHMPELRQVLSDRGLDLSGADVQTSLFENREHDDGSRPDGGEGSRQANDEFETTPSLRRGGYLTAEGLDFWV